jgi:hypothetical protein
VRSLHSEPVLCLGAPPDNSAAVSGAADCLVAVTPLRGGGGGGGGGGAAGEARAEPTELGSPLCRLEIPTTGEAEHEP